MSFALAIPVLIAVTTTHQAPGAFELRVTDLDTTLTCLAHEGETFGVRIQSRDEGDGVTIGRVEPWRRASVYDNVDCPDPILIDSERDRVLLSDRPSDNRGTPLPNHGDVISGLTFCTDSDGSGPDRIVMYVGTKLWCPRELRQPKASVPPVAFDNRTLQDTTLGGAAPAPDLQLDLVAFGRVRIDEAAKCRNGVCRIPGFPANEGRRPSIFGIEHDATISLTRSVDSRYLRRGPYVVTNRRAPRILLNSRPSLNDKPEPKRVTVTLPEPPPSSVNCQFADHAGRNVELRWEPGAVGGLSRTVVLRPDVALDATDESGWSFSCVATPVLQRIDTADFGLERNIGWLFANEQLAIKSRALAVLPVAIVTDSSQWTTPTRLTRSVTIQIERLRSLGATVEELSAGTGGAGRSLSFAIPPELAEAFQHLTEIALDRAKAGAFRLVRRGLERGLCEELQVTNAQLDGVVPGLAKTLRTQRVNLGFTATSSVVVLRRSCETVRTLRLQDLYVQVRRLYRSVQSDIADLAFAAAQARTDALDDPRLTTLLDAFLGRLGAFVSSFIQEEDLEPHRAAQTLMVGLAKDTTRLAAEQSDVASCGLAVAFGAMAVCRANTQCDARTITAILDEPKKHFRLESCEGHWDRTAVAELAGAVSRGVALLDVPRTATPSELIHAAVELSVELVLWLLRRRAVVIRGEVERVAKLVDDTLEAAKALKRARAVLDPGRITTLVNRERTKCPELATELSFVRLDRTVAQLDILLDQTAGLRRGDPRALEQRPDLHADPLRIALESLEDVPWPATCGPDPRPDLRRAVDAAEQLVAAQARWNEVTRLLAHASKEQRAFIDTWMKRLGGNARMSAQDLLSVLDPSQARRIASLEALLPLFVVVQELARAVVRGDAAGALLGASRLLASMKDFTGSGAQIAFRRMSQLLAAMTAYAQTYADAAKDLPAEDLKEKRKEIIETAIDSFTDRGDRGGDVVFSLGTAVGFRAIGGHFRYGTDDGRYAFAPQLALPLGLAVQQLPGKSLLGWHLGVYALDLGQFVAYGDDIDSESPEWNVFVTPGLQAGALIGTAEDTVLVGLDAHYGRSETIDDGFIRVGLVLAYYVSLFDLN
ncbi:MAG: hypothetical protein RMA76_38630 [Deltaproteobacteria bacterium]|jgi:hypothetical protein